MTEQDFADRVEALRVRSLAFGDAAQTYHRLNSREQRFLVVNCPLSAASRERPTSPRHAANARDSLSRSREAGTEDWTAVNGTGRGCRIRASRSRETSTARA